MNSQFFDIFRNDDTGEPIWVEAVENLETAKQRIIQLSSQRPGQYMIFSNRTGQIVTKVTTIASPAAHAEHRNGDTRSKVLTFPPRDASETVF